MKQHIHTALLTSIFSTCLLGMNKSKQPMSVSDASLPIVSTLSAGVPAPEEPKIEQITVSLPVVRTRILKPVYRFTHGAPNFYFTERDLKQGEQPPNNSIKIHTPRGNVFYVEAQGPSTGSIFINHKLWQLILYGFLNDLGFVEKGFLRSAQGVAYTDIQCVKDCVYGTVLVAKFANGSHRLFFAESGQEIGALRNAQGVAYTNIQYVGYCAYSTVLVAKFANDICRLFKAKSGQEIELKNEYGVAYTNIRNVWYCAYGTVLRAKLTDGSYRLFSAESCQEIGTLRNAQGVAYTNIRNVWDCAGGRLLDAQFFDNSHHLFKADGQEIGSLRNAQGVAYTNIINVQDCAGGTVLCAQLTDRSCRLFKANGQEIGALRSAQGVAYTNIEYVFVYPGGLRARLTDNSCRLFDTKSGQEIKLRNEQGVAYTDIQWIGGCANGRLLVGHNDGCLLFPTGSSREISSLKNIDGSTCTNIEAVYPYRAGCNKVVLVAQISCGFFNKLHSLFSSTFEIGRFNYFQTLFSAENGQEIGTLRNAQGVVYENINVDECAGGRLLMASRNNGLLEPRGPYHLFNFDGREVELGIAYKKIYSLEYGFCLQVNNSKALLFRGLVNDPVKNFGGLSWQKVLFLMMAKRGLLQKYFAIDLENQNFLERIYTSIPEHTRNILQQSPYNLPKSFLSKSNESHDESTVVSSCTLI